MKIEHLNIDDVVLDIQNPRIAPSVESIANEPTMEWIQLALGVAAPSESGGTATTFEGLKNAIRANKGLTTPIFVERTEDGKYIVIEGNTRVSIYHSLALEGAAGDWSTIPAIVRDSSNEDARHAIRLQAHLVGPRPWTPYAKAKYLHSLFHENRLSKGEILAFCGGKVKESEIENYIKAFSDMREHYFEILDGQPPDYQKFSAFVELQKKSITTALVNSGYDKTSFANWVHEGKFSPLQNVRHLPRILADSQARQKFLDYDSREAIKILDQPAPDDILRNSSVAQLARALATAIRKLDWPEVSQIMNHPEGEDADALRECHDELLSIVSRIYDEDSGA